MVIDQPPYFLRFSLSAVGSSFNAVQDERIGGMFRMGGMGRAVQEGRTIIPLLTNGGGNGKISGSPLAYGRSLTNGSAGKRRCPD